jgi:CheY-like chemotaxis protein
MNSEILFADEDTDSLAVATGQPAPWQILIVDDDSDVHLTTKFAFSNVTHLDRAIAFKSAFSGLEAISLILNSPASLPDLVLMDVVMTTPTDGIDTTRRIRQLLDQRTIPYVIIRTGQAGTLLDENALKSDPDIDAVVFKQDLTAEKLHAIVFRGLDKVLQQLKDVDAS